VGCRTILAWFAAEGISSSCGEQIIVDVRKQWVVAQQTGHVPPVASFVDMPVTEIIRQCSPIECEANEVGIVTWFAQWLAHWVYYALPDRRIRDAALNLRSSSTCSNAEMDGMIHACVSKGS
jgi:hypothetical protein